MNRIVVTGGMGFIGHNVVNLLEQTNHVNVIDSRTTYGIIPIDELNYLISERDVKVGSRDFIVDIRDTSKVEQIIGDSTNVIIHLASFPRQKVAAADPATASEVMMTGLINVLESAKKGKVEKFVYISSSMVYGDFCGTVSEDAVCSPIGQYAIMKYAGEKLVEDYGRQTGMKVVIIRPSAVYGENDVADRVVSKFMIAAMRGGTLKVNGPDEILDFTHVDDAAKGIAMAAVSDDASGIYNITRSNPNLCSLLEAAELIVKIAGKGTIEVKGRDLAFPSRGRLSIARAHGHFGYEPTINIEEGFQRYYNWFNYSSYWQSKLNG